MLHKPKRLGHPQHSKGKWELTLKEAYNLDVAFGLNSANAVEAPIGQDSVYSQ
jgi:hypothetical protein